MFLKNFVTLCVVATVISLIKPALAHEGGDIHLHPENIGSVSTLEVLTQIDPATWSDKSYLEYVISPASNEVAELAFDPEYMYFGPDSNEAVSFVKNQDYVLNRSYMETVESTHRYHAFVDVKTVSKLKNVNNVRFLFDGIFLKTPGLITVEVYQGTIDGPAPKKIDTLSTSAIEVPVASSSPEASSEALPSTDSAQLREIIKNTVRKEAPTGFETQKTGELSLFDRLLLFVSSFFSKFK